MTTEDTRKWDSYIKLLQSNVFYFSRYKKTVAYILNFLKKSKKI